MSEQEHLAVAANRKSIQYAMEGNREGWVGLYADDAVVQDPVGVSGMDPSGEGHRGREAIAAFFDATIAPSNLEIIVDKRWTSGDYCCCVAQKAHNTIDEGKVVVCDMLALYEVNQEGRITRMAAHWDYEALMQQLAEVVGG